MKKILYVTTVSRTINAFLIPHIEMLLSKGYKVDCACAVDKSIDKKLLSKGVKVYEVPFSRNPLGIGNYKAYRRLLDIQRVNNYDIMHVHTPVASIYGRLVKKTFRNLKTIYTAHGYHFFNEGSKIAWLIYYPIEKIMAKLTDITININKEDYEITKEKLKPKNCYLLNGVGLSLDQYKKSTEEEIASKKIELGLKEEDFVVIMIAELNENKNHIQIIKAMEILKDKYSNIKVISVGEGEKFKEIKEEVEKRNLQKNIRLLGFRKDINELINVSNIGILLSHREGLPRNIMELMANGRKIIATNIRGCKDIVVNENVGTLVNVGDYEETAKAIEKYFLGNDKEFKIPEEIKKYDIKNIADKLSKVYEEIEWNQNDEMSRKFVEYHHGI